MSVIQAAGFFVGLLAVIAATIVSLKHDTGFRVLGSNALSVFLYGAALTVVSARNAVNDSIPVYVDAGLVVLCFACFIVGYFNEKKQRSRLRTKPEHTTAD